MPSRRRFIASAAALAAAAASRAYADAAPAPPKDIHQQLLDLARDYEAKRRARFQAVKSPDDLRALQEELRAKFVALLNWKPSDNQPPPARVVDTIEGDGYRIEKIVYQSFPDYHVPALLYWPTKTAGKVPGILSPCGHSTTGKAADSYQILHINLAKRGFAVLTFDPVGQGERSQYWDAARKRSRYNLTCGEHAVLGNPLYLLGTSLAKYRIWDGVRGIDYLASLEGIDAAKIGCVGNSGGGTLSAYISALDPRVQAAVISCYITTLPRRMANRIEADPDADPEQDIFGFVSEGIDHAGLLALRAPKPTLVCSAQFDFFPIEGAKESCDETKRFFQIAGAENRFAQAIAQEKHGLTLPLREATYAWFERWLADRPNSDAAHEKEIPVKPRPASELQVCPEGQVRITYQSRHLLDLAPNKEGAAPAEPLEKLLGLADEKGAPKITTLVPAKPGATWLVFVDGNASPGWEIERDFAAAAKERGLGAVQLEPRGVGALRPKKEVKGSAYDDPLCGVEENIAYNAFLVGRSLVGMRVADVLAGVAQLRKDQQAKSIVLVGRNDAAFIATLAAAVEPTITHLAVEGLILKLMSLFSPDSPPINAASILPRLWLTNGDMENLFAKIVPRPVLASASRGAFDAPVKGVRLVADALSKQPSVLFDWLKGA